MRRSCLGREVPTQMTPDHLNSSPVATPDPAPLFLALLDWYDRHRRDLPWRAGPGDRVDPYHVLVSELMLQQTTVATVSSRFAGFIERFPSLRALAEAGETEVLHAWQGLGYYRRARALHALAGRVMRDHGGMLPAAVDRLLTLPGIGAYTARAIASIAFDRPVIPVDGNVMRVLARLFRIEAPLPKASRDLHKLAAALEPCPRPGDVAQALMDLGAMVCRPIRPRCDVCPWHGVCQARSAGLAAILPRRSPKPPRPMRQGVAFLLVRPDGAVLFRKRPAGGLLGGLHDLPSSSWTTAPLDRNKAIEQAPAVVDWHFHAVPIRHVFTHFTLRLDLAEGRTDRPPEGLWRRRGEFNRLALPTVTKKLLRHAGLL